MLKRMPPRLPPDGGYTPSARSDAPRGTPGTGCVESPSAITLYALEVLHPVMLRELLCLWSASSRPDLRHVHDRDTGWQIASTYDAARANAVELTKRKADAVAVDKLRRTRQIEIHGPRWTTGQEATLAHYRADARRSSVVDRQATRARLKMLDDVLRLGAGWTRRDIAKLIIASETDWTMPPIAGGVAGSLRDPEKLEKWIFERLRDDARNENRRRKSVPKRHRA